MGQYICIGICTGFSLSTSEAERNFSTPAALETELKKIIDLSLYTRVDEKDAMLFELKDEALEKNLEGLLREFYDYNGVSELAQENVFTGIEGLDAKDLMALAERKSHTEFQYSSHFFEWITGDKFSDSVCVSAELIILSLNGKAMLECYGQLFRYIETIQRKALTSPLKGALKVMLSM